MSPATLSFDPFRVLSEEERVRYLADYRAFLAERDGVPDVASRTLSRREARMREIETNPIVWSGALKHEAFSRFIAGDRRGPFDGRTELALAAALANESENYGVDIELRRFAKHGKLPGLRAADLLLSVYVQEAYHCRLLVELCTTCGIDFRPRCPGMTIRGLIALIGALPGWMRWVPVMAGEVVATAVFRILYARLELFAAHPEAHARLRQIVREVWADEIGHVGFLRAQLGQGALVAVRLLLPIVAAAVLRDLPPLVELGITRSRILDDLRSGIELPSEMAWLEESAFAAPSVVAQGLSHA
jgi:hypothetical protein